jgi:hypothetical protein
LVQDAELFTHQFVTQATPGLHPSCQQLSVLTSTHRPGLQAIAGKRSEFVGRVRA